MALNPMFDLKPFATSHELSNETPKVYDKMKRVKTNPVMMNKS